MGSHAAGGTRQAGGNGHGVTICPAGQSSDVVPREEDIELTYGLCLLQRSLPFVMLRAPLLARSRRCEILVFHIYATPSFLNIVMPEYILSIIERYNV